MNAFTYYHVYRENASHFIRGLFWQWIPLQEGYCSSASCRLATMTAMLCLGDCLRPLL
jgi:hypothetical protein